MTSITSGPTSSEQESVGVERTGISKGMGETRENKARDIARCWAIPPVRLALSGRNSGKTPETLSESFLEFPSRVRLGCPKPYNSKHLRLPEHFQNYLPPSTAGGVSFFQKWFRRGPPEPVMEFPAVLGVFLSCSNGTL